VSHKKPGVLLQCWLLLSLLMAVLGHVRGLEAHESRPASLEINETAPGRYDVLWRTPLLAGMRLPVRLVFPEAVRNVTEPRESVLADSVVERRVIDAGQSRLSGQRMQFVGLQATITDVLVRVSLLNGAHWTVLVRPSQPWVEFSGTKSAVEVARTYLAYGVEHIVFGIDHLLFVFGLLLIVQDRWMLLKTVTSFTLAHSLTLAIATLGYASAPMLPLNAAIALSILFLGPEIVHSWRGETSLTIRHPWLVAFVFGLLHGFGFASALTGAGLPRRDLPLALCTFNVGVELGQVAFVVLMVRLERSFQQLEIRWPRWVEMVPGYVVGSLGAFWTIQRTAILIGGLR
jgi:hydrogenase/urease accessory protein HupE